MTRRPSRERRAARSGWIAPMPGVLMILPALLLPVGAAAKSVPISELRAKVDALEQKAAYLDVKYPVGVDASEQIAEHRLVDAQVLYTLKDYTRAAIILLDYVSKYKESRGYAEAVFFLADSLYHKRDFLSARRYFKMIVHQIRGRYYQEALQRLVELAMRTGEYEEVEQYIDALSNIPTSMLKPSVPYVQAKYYYFRNRLDRAVQILRSIPKGHTYYFHARYFLGATLVRQDKLAEAARVYNDLLKVEPKGASEIHIRELAFLASGRLLYEEGNMDQAIRMYQRVSRRSPEFDSALHEIAWAYIKARQYQRALRALELLVLSDPESPFIPQVKVLQGNLLIRLEEWKRATKLFTGTREKFVPVHSRMRQVMAEQSDPNVFFDLLLARNVGAFSTTIKVPPLAVHWVKEKPSVKKALNVVQDVREIQDSIKEARQLIMRLERAINSPAKIRIFPEFARAKARALEVENRVTLLLKSILEHQNELASQGATDRDQAKLSQLLSSRRDLEKRVTAIPTTAKGYEQREREKIKKLQTLSHDATKLSLMLDSLNAQLVATEKYFADTASSKDETARSQFRTDSRVIRNQLRRQSTDLTEVQQAIDDAKNTVGVGGPDEVAERGTKARYRSALVEEQAFLEQSRARLAGRRAADFDTLAELFTRCIKITETLEVFDRRLETEVDKKLTDIRATLAEEVSNVAQYEVQAKAYRSQTDVVAGGLTYAAFHDVAQRFYEIVVRADVGIIDVAWALKDVKSKEVSRLVRQQKLDLKVLDKEFEEVLRDD